MFRGNPTRTFYGAGPVPESPGIVWRYPEKPMCGRSTVAGQTKLWCGTGWTGQPVVWARPDGATEIIFGAYDKAVHFVDADSGLATRPRFQVGDLIKGTVTLDPDGFPLLYFGSRDNKLRIIALDREVPTELWARDAYESVVRWNDDWDSNPVIIDDVMYEGGENGWFYAFKLNRSYDSDGRVVVEPDLLVEFSTYDPAFTSERGPQVSIENSVAVYGRTAYFANSTGRIMGLDISRATEGKAPLVFDYWVGDDVDATIVIDGEGALYVGAELERFTSRSEDVGQLIKLNPRLVDPLVWSVFVPPANSGDSGGIWATPALGDGVIYAATDPGELLVVDAATGAVVWRDDIGVHAWSSPVLAAGTLVVAVNCDAGAAIRAYDITDPRRPVQAWEVPLDTGGCIESTPAVWQGRLYVGSRDGYFYAFGDAAS